MEMAGDEIVADGSGGQIVARQENPGESAGEKKRNEAEREKHGGVELDARVPERAEPTDEEDAGGQSEGGGQKRKDERRKGIQAAGEHVFAPDAKTEDAYATQRQNNESFLPGRLAGKRGNQMRDEAEAREYGDVDFGLRKKPEEAPPKNGNSVCDDTGGLIGNEIQHGEKARAQEAIRKQADAGCQENAENQHPQDGIDEPGPDSQGKPREGHALGAQVDGGDAESERVGKGRGTEDGDADDPKRDAGLRKKKERRREAHQRGHRGPQRQEVQRGESHFARADLQRQEVISEAGLGAAVSTRKTINEPWSVVRAANRSGELPRLERNGRCTPGHTR